jgi:hypothetical protein
MMKGIMGIWANYCEIHITRMKLLFLGFMKMEIK